ncbi:L-fuculokinase [Atopobium sp. oral taxon 416]|uniref:FGGY-family carbohydrate kinase n=1 Tax=Atopobium sp. oral taxon 416 TaxID=712157 RepID=UPI001BAB6960|nr:FGGY family carbohydrate kinase [Atopobium sp. oral taxon 416]QUC03255.1 hypothetical protein J4859_14965 [Atopobium sp. oral taxon 416]
MSYAIGVDVGTTNTKAVLCELPSCDPVYIERFPSPKITEGRNTDYDTRRLVNGVYSLLEKCTNWLGEKSEEIEFVSVASVGESGVLVYPDGSFSKRSIFWYDSRGEEYSEEAIRSGYSNTLYRVTGIPVHSNSALFKILWMRDHGFRLEGAKWLTMADFVAWRLCGNAFQDRTFASRTSAYDIVSDKMSAEILNHYGIPKSLFAELIPSGESRGSVTAETRFLTGLPRGCMVRVSGHDHMSGAIACDLKEEGEALNSTGTSEGLLILEKAPRLDDDAEKRQITNGRFVFPDVFTTYVSVPAAGLSFEWILKTLNIPQEEFFGEGQERLYSAYLRGEFATSNLVYVPHLRGSGPPHRSSDSKGCFYGMSDTTSREEILFSTHLGVSIEFARLCDCMIKDSGLLDDMLIKVIGPATNNPLWMQLKADALGIRFVACDVAEAVARGSVIVSARSAGYRVHPHYQTKEYLPDSSRHGHLVDFMRRLYIPISNAIGDVESRLGK